MATRSTLSIGNAVHLYRHWDGYPAGAGRDLARILRGLRVPGEYDAPAYLARKLATKLIRTGHWELTDRADNHGDREWHYDVWLGSEAVRVSQCDWHTGDVMRVAFAGSLGDFRRYLARESWAMLARHKQVMRATKGGAR